MSQPSEAPLPLGPRGSPTFSGKAEAALASIHRAPEPLASQQWPSLPRSETLHLSSLWVLHSSLDIVPRLSHLSLFLSLAQSGSFSRIPLHLDLFKSPIQLVFSSFSGVWKF